MLFRSLALPASADVRLRPNRQARRRAGACPGSTPHQPTHHCQGQHLYPRLRPPAIPRKSDCGAPPSRPTIVRVLGQRQQGSMAASGRHRTVANVRFRPEAVGRYLQSGHSTTAMTGRRHAKRDGNATTMPVGVPVDGEVSLHAIGDYRGRVIRPSTPSLARSVLANLCLPR